MLEKTAPSDALGSTARWTAAVRAVESAREDRLFNDPWATAQARPEGTAWAANRSPDNLAPMVLRIRFFDDFLERITSENSVRQVVLMAAGLDTRLFRLAWPVGTQPLSWINFLYCKRKNASSNQQAHHQAVYATSFQPTSPSHGGSRFSRLGLIPRNLPPGYWRVFFSTSQMIVSQRY
jgi:hypothetical protein